MKKRENANIKSKTQDLREIPSQKEITERGGENSLYQR